MISKSALLDKQFLEFRCKLIEVAAFLDRLERYPGENDFRERALRQALPILLWPHGGRGRACAILEALSDNSEQPVAAATTQGAFGAVHPKA